MQAPLDLLETRLVPRGGQLGECRPALAGFLDILPVVGADNAALRDSLRVRVLHTARRANPAGHDEPPYFKRSVSAAPLSSAVCRSCTWNSCIRFASTGSLAPRMRTASRPALRAPPIDTVATGTPAGICTIDSSESIPSRYFSGTGTPITGSVVAAATIPGKCAAPPAPAISTRIPRSAAVSA